MSVLGPQDKGLEGVVLAGRYRIEKRLGAGGMGEVYRAVNTVIDRPVAIKVLHRELTRNQEIVERFLREAKAAIIVRHPNVVDVLDVLEHEGVPFIVQELLNGRDLSHYIEAAGGKLGVDEVLPLLIPVVEAVGSAHAKGVVHRDIKPENVFLHEVEGQVVPKVLDFGISKLTAAGAKRMTSTGTAMGTPAYMSPEQIQGSAEVDARGDVWSFGVVLFEVLSGRLPYESETAGGLFVQICTKVAPKLDTVTSGLPPALVDIVAKCLAPNREQRYASATELARALRAIMAERGVDSTHKLQAIGPTIIETLEARGGLASGPALSIESSTPNAEAKTAVGRMPAAASKQTARATPAALADEHSDRRQDARDPAVSSKGRSTVLVAGAGVLLVTLIGVVALKARGDAPSAPRSEDAGVAATSVADAAAQLARRQDDRDASALTAAITAVEDAAPVDNSAALAADESDASIAAEPAERGETGRRRHTRATRDAGARLAQSVTSTTTATTAAATQATQGASAAHATQSATTVTTVSGRQTHAATTYEP
jgi:serine/threonine-protein kinase